jgi:DNA-binding response OmpR family regulator
MGDRDALEGPSQMHHSIALDERSVGDAPLASHPPHVLVVEDDQDFASVVRLGLESGGYHVEVTSSVSEARRRLRDHNEFALVISDVRLPGKSGLQLLFSEDSEEAGGTPPVLMMSAFVSPELRHFVEGMGAAVIEKPFSFATLRVNVIRALQRRRRHERLQRASKLLLNAVPHRQGGKAAILPSRSS